MFNIAVITDPIECLLKETDTTLGIINILQKNNKIFYIDTTTIPVSYTHLTLPTNREV